MMIRLLIISFLLSPFIGFSQSQYDKKSDADPRATEILNGISSYFKAQDAMEIEFQVDYYFSNQEEPEKTIGSIVQSGNKYNLDLGTQKIISNGEILWIYDSSFNEVSLNNAEEIASGFFVSPAQFYDFYKYMNLTYVLANETTEDGKPVQKIEFKPLDNNEFVTKVRMTTSKEDQQIIRVKAFLRDGSIFVINLNNYKENPDILSNHFEFDTNAFPGVHVEDLRID